MRLVAAGLTALLLTTLTACADDPAAKRPAADQPTRTTTGASPGEENNPPKVDPTSSADDPVLAEAETAPLDWAPVDGPTTTAVTVSGDWTLSLPDSAREATLDGPEPTVVEAPARHRITDALIDGEYAVVVSEDERAQQPNVATVVDLVSGDTFRVDGDSDVPTTTGGTWALGEGRLLHATIGDGGAYCLATVDLADRSSTTTWCAPKRHGFNDARVTEAGTSLLTFDDQRPSCRTVGEVLPDELAPFGGVPDCTGWDALLLAGGEVWSVAAKANRIEEANFFARTGSGWYDLGPGTSGSLVACGDAAYFVRDPQRDGDPARLMRWSSDGTLTVAYESRGGRAFLSEPRCGGDTITVTALAESGDEQVSADVR